ncbi:MAG: galactitol-1-phosphate 5-dehydrogenase [Lachnospiraceae bacterium]|nr:galactitol-1-phosphate 5-dehydrogenase [Lachnospiraceae bacterium]
MKAWVLHGINDIRFEEMNKPVPPAGEVLVKVCAAGICGSDIPRIYDTGAHRHPLIPGHEFSGVVEAVGEGVGAAWIGQRAGIFPLIPCKECAQCRRKQYEMCSRYDYLGSRRDGGFAEYVSVPVWNLLKLPDTVSDEAAAMLEPMAVAVHAMRIGLGGQQDAGRSAEGATGMGSIAVCGLGTIGLLLSMFLLEKGVEELLVIGNKAFQMQQAIKLGIPADHYCDSKKENAADWIMRKTGGCGVDLYFECVGRNETAALGLDAAAPGGRVVFMGNPHSDMLFSRDVYWKILRKQLTVLGTWNSAYTKKTSDDWHYVLQKLNDGRITPERLITHRLPLHELGKGFRIMRDKTEEYCKIMAVGNTAAGMQTAEKG